MKRIVDLAVAGTLLLLLTPLLILIAALIWVYDRHSPFYRGVRVGQCGREFRMLKFRSMEVNADRSGVTSTAGDDPRITPIGRFVRRFKLDELPQLLNVLVGHMSLVGPRPNVPSGTALFTDPERQLLTVRPGVTDFASIVFADESEILRGCDDPDEAYDRLIRPWKSRLGLFYIEHASFVLDMKLVLLTITAILSRPRALTKVAAQLRCLGAPDDLVRVSRRSTELESAIVPGMNEPVGR